MKILLTPLFALFVIPCHGQIQRGFIFQADLDQVCIVSNTLDSCHATNAAIEGGLGLFNLIENNEVLTGEIDDGVSIDGCYIFRGKTKDNTPFIIHLKNTVVLVDFQLTKNPISLLYTVSAKDGFSQITVQKQ